MNRRPVPSRSFFMRKCDPPPAPPLAIMISMAKTIATLRGLDLPSLDRLAAAMVARLPSQIVIGLVGTLGAGKTALTQAIARASGVDVAEVTSPTFTLLQTHRGRFTLHHLDAYRVADEDEFLELGVEELFEEPNSWTIVEWADRVESVMPLDTLWLHLEIELDDRRTVIAGWDDDLAADRLAAVEAELCRERCE